MENKNKPSKLKDLQTQIKTIKAELYETSEKSNLEKRLKLLREKAFEYKLSQPKTAKKEFVLFILNDEISRKLIINLIKKEIGTKVRTNWSQDIRNEELDNIKLPIKELDRPENLYLKHMVLRVLHLAYNSLAKTMHFNPKEKAEVTKALKILKDKIGNKSQLDKTLMPIVELLIDSPEMKKDCMTASTFMKNMRNEIHENANPEWSQVMFYIEKALLHLVFPEIKTGMDRKSYDQRMLRLKSVKKR
jgi:hypothetical protein